MRESVVITGMGVVCAAGLGREAFANGLREPAVGVVRGTLQAEDQPFELMLGAVEDASLTAAIEPRRHLNFKHMSRSGVMVCAAADMATKDARFNPDEQTRERTGILMGTAFGGIQSMLKFNSDVRSKGPAVVNPIIFPDTVSNAPAGYAAISFGLMGMNATLSSGFASGLTAIRMAYEHVASGVLAAALAGGYDELIPHLCQYWKGSGSLSSSVTEEGPASIPFDQRRDGFYAGEGAVILLLERKSVALHRGARVYGEILGFGSCQANAHDGKSDGKRAAMQEALGESAIDPAQVGAAFSSANGSVDGDLDEASALEAVLGCDVPVSAVKAFTGETMGAAGPASVAAALLTLQSGCVPGIPKLQADREKIKIKISQKAMPMLGKRYCLVNAFGLDSAGESVAVGAVDK